jgi:drug/metabolite transporter (DMT)-like permease
MVAGVLLAVHFLLWMESLFIIPVGVSTTVVVTYPLLSVLIDHFLFKEKPTFLQVLGLSVGLIGVLFFMHPGVLAGYDSYGVLLSFGGALGATGYFSIGRFVRKKTNLLNYTTLAYTSTALTLVLYALVSGENLLNHSLQTYRYFSLLAILPMIGGHTLINYVLRYLKTSVATSIALGEPVGASILAYFILDQPLDLPKALVMTLVLASIALTV